MISSSFGLRQNRIAFLAMLFFCAFGLSAQETKRKNGEVWLAIPEQQTEIEPNGSASLSAKPISYLQLHIYTSNQINYGSIHTKINTEAANVVMTVNGTSDGILCNLDLRRRPGFEINPGRNSLEIEFADAHQRIHYASYLLQVPEAGDKQLAPPHPKSAPVRSGGTKYAVVVGISKYQHQGSGLNNLNYADRDAQEFLAFLQSPAGGSYSKENIVSLFNEDATLQNLRSALFTFLTKPGEDDSVILFFASHGDEDPHDNRNLYLLTYDTDPDNMGGTAFPMWELQEAFQRVLKARRVITFADSCHSFGISGEQANVSLKENNLINQYFAKVASTNERAVITASDISEKSSEDARWGGGHGVFTYFLLQGLQGAADANHDGTVTTGELFAYLNAQVRKATGNAQHPKAIPGSAENIPLSGPLVRSQLVPAFHLASAFH